MLFVDNVLVNETKEGVHIKLLESWMLEFKSQQLSKIGIKLGGIVKWIILESCVKFLEEPRY